MRKRSAYRPRPATPPMLVSRGLIDEDLELRERQIVEAFSGGWAGKEHFDELCDMRNVITLAGAYKDDQQAMSMSEAMRILMGNVRDRFARTGRMGVTGDELAMLREFVTFYRDFWIRQPVQLYLRACAELNQAMKAPCRIPRQNALSDPTAPQAQVGSTDGLKGRP